jgi:hypothetical protein
VDSVQELENTKARLQACGVEVLGVTDHHIFKSIYFFDPNGIRLELTAQLADELQMLKESKTAHARLDEWTARKEQWRKERAEGNDRRTNRRPEARFPRDDALAAGRLGPPRPCSTPWYMLIRIANLIATSA